MSNDPLLQPYRLKHLTLRNRLVFTAHEPAYSEDGMPKARYRRYHEERAKGGVALTMTAGSALVSRDSPPAFGNLLAYRDEIVPWLRELAEACHGHGAKVMIQLTHLGRRSAWNTGDWLPVVAPSNVREPAHRAFPKVIEDWDVARILADYADAAERMVAAGLDGIELECYGHLIDGFWSPATNSRDDDWGGALENRLHFVRLVLDAIRDRVGPDFIVGIRMAMDEDWDKGFGPEEGIEIARRLVATGQIDFLNVIRGHIETDAALARVIPVQGTPTAPHLDFAGEVRAATGVPIIHAARINDVATARHAVAAGKVDMIGMTRAQIAEPHLGRKLAEGREAEIRPCVGATYCLDRIYEGGEALCIHNPATGREATMPHEIKARAEMRRKVVIVGAGPAGLEAARVAGARGHEVVVFEAAPQAGGQVRLAAQSPRRRELIGIIDWRLERCAEAGVALRYNHWAEAGDVLAEDPDVVLIATGGLPNTEVLDAGNELAHSTWDILAGDVVPGRNVLMFDDHGSAGAMQAAELIAAGGARLEIVTPERMFSPEIGGLNLTGYIARLQPLDVTFTVMRRLLSVAREGNALRAAIGSDHGPARTERMVDQVVVDHGTVPLDGRYFELKGQSSNLGAVDYDALIDGRPQALAPNPEGRFQLFRLGDAVACRNIHAAIYDALRLVKDL